MANGSDDDIIYDVDLNLKDFKKHKNELDKSFLKTQKRAKETSKNMEAGFNRSTVAVGALAVGVVALSTAIKGVGEFTKKMVSETGQLETATVKWEVLTGSVEEAESRIKSIRAFSDRTPFTFKGVNEASEQIYNLSNGILQTEKDLQLLGDASAKGGVPINELSQTWGRLFQKLSQGDKAFAEEINRMNELGIITGETKKQLQSMNESELMNQGWEVFTKGASRASGMMEKLSQTIEGKLSTLEGVWDGIFAFEDKEVQESIKSSIDVLINSLNNNKDEIQNVISDIFGVLSDFTEEWIDGALKIYGLFKSEDSLSNTMKGVKSGAITRGDVIAERTGLIRSSAMIGDRGSLMDNLGSLAKESGVSQQEFASIYSAILDNDKNQIEIIKTAYPKMTESLNKLVKINENQARIDELTKIDDLDLYKKAVKEIVTENKKAGGVGTGSGTTGDESTFDVLAELEEIQRVRDEANQKNAEIELQIAEMKAELADLGVTGDESSYAGVIEAMDNAIKPLKTDRIGGANTIVQATDNGFQQLIDIHENWSKNSLKNFAQIGQALSSGAGGIAGGIEQITGSSLGNLIPGLGLATSAFGFISTISGLFDSSDDSDVTNQTIANNAENKADIVSSGVDTIIVNANMTLNTTYVDEAGFDELFNEQIAPRIAETVQGVY